MYTEARWSSTAFRPEYTRGTATVSGNAKTSRSTRQARTFEHGLRGEVEFVEKDPVPRLEGLEEDSVAPCELASFAAVHGEVQAQQVHHVRLLAQVDADHLVARGSRQGSDQARLANTGRTLEQQATANEQRPHRIQCSESEYKASGKASVIRRIASDSD